MAGWLTAHLLAHWGHLSQRREGPQRWGEAARTILEEAPGETAIEVLLMETEAPCCEGVASKYE